MIFNVLGIGNKKQVFSKEHQELIRTHRIFSGGQRHYELVKHLLPEHHEWIFIKGPLESVFHKYEEANENILVFASGDPLFYGFSNTLRKKYPKHVIHTFPYFSSIQLLAAKAGLDSSQIQTVSVHGRTWDALDESLIRQNSITGVLTDQEKNPAAIAQRLLDFGFDNYQIWVGEDLEGSEEKVRLFVLEEAVQGNFHSLNCVLLQKKWHRNIQFGLPDADFSGLEGRPNMITKMPVRLCSLHFLDLNSRTVLWDIGFCTGSLSIEAKIRFPHLKVFAFEKRPECGEIMRINQKKFGAPGIESLVADIFELDLNEYPKPDAVFIGGHGGRLKELLTLLDPLIQTEGVIVINAVREDSISAFTTEAGGLGWKLEDSLTLQTDQHNPITIIKAIKNTTL